LEVSGREEQNDRRWHGGIGEGDSFSSAKRAAVLASSGMQPHEGCTGHGIEPSLEEKIGKTAALCERYRCLPTAPLRLTRRWKSHQSASARAR